MFDLEPIQAVGAAALFFVIGFVAGLARGYIRRLVSAA